MQVERLSRRHDRALFHCGNGGLDAWFHRHALQADGRSESARTFVLADGERVLGFYSLAAFAVSADEASDDLLRGQPRYPIVPAVLLARLAIDVSCQGQGLGTRLLADGVRRVIAAAEHMAVVLLVVDAVDESAAGFYEHHGFRRAASPSKLRLLARAKDLRRTLGA